MLDPNSLSLSSIAIGLAIGGSFCSVIGYLLGATKQRKLAQTQLQVEAAQRQQIALELHAAQQHVLHKEQSNEQLTHELSRIRDEATELGFRNTELEKHNAALNIQASQINDLKNQLQHWQTRFENSQQQLSEKESQYQSAIAKHEEENKANEEKLALLQQAEQHLQIQFENLANKIFQQKSEKFTETNKAGLDALLAPLKDQIEGFKKQVTDQHIRDGQERASLKTEILNLRDLNTKITQEAAALTKALKGDNKQQGNWGEVVLERILAESGLREGHEFDTQGQFKDANGKAFKPDIIVHLPQEKDVIIDSKVSLNAYEQYFNGADEDIKQRALKEHVQSLRNHIRELGKKDYHKLHGIQSLDYVLMFVPVEPAYLLAIDQAPDLIQQAIEANIMLVSPTNLMVALRTINNIWQYEYQNQNAQIIAEKASNLYDKFHGFVTDMEKLGDNLNTVQKRYDDACKKLYSGRGNLVRRTEEFRTLGVQTSKKLDVERLEASE